MSKLLALGASSLIGMGLTFLFPPPPGPDGPPPPPDEKKKAGPAGDLRKAYDSIRRLRPDEGRGSRPEERLRDWADRAAGLYRKGVKAFEQGDGRLAHEYGAMAHDLARAADHAANAVRLDRRDDDDLPPPPGDRDADRRRVNRDLRHAYDRIQDLDDRDAGEDAGFYLRAAIDLYHAARRDAEAGRLDRAGELARAAEAMTHVPEHLAHIDHEPDGPPPDRKEREKAKEKDRAKAKEKAREKEKHRRPDPKKERPGDDELPPPIR